MKIVNKKAYYNYQVIEDFTAGLMLVGSEVKSIRENNFNFGDSFIIFKDGELYVKNMSISKYKEATFQNHEEMRDRKILLTKKEISKISKLTEVRGITMIPLEIFTIRGRFKLKVGVCRGKKDWNKKDSIKKKILYKQNDVKICDIHFLGHRSMRLWSIRPSKRYSIRIQTSIGQFVSEGFASGSLQSSNSPSTNVCSTTISSKHLCSKTTTIRIEH